MSYDSKGRLSRAGMEAVHKSGGSVLHNGMIYAPGTPLPSEAELAADRGDKSEVDRVRLANEAEIKRLQEENKQLKEAATPLKGVSEPAPVAPPVVPPPPVK